MLNRIFCFPFVRGVSSELAPARPFPWGDAPLPLWLKLVDCIFKKYFCVQFEFQFGNKLHFLQNNPGLKRKLSGFIKIGPDCFQSCPLTCSFEPHLTFQQETFLYKEEGTLVRSTLPMKSENLSIEGEIFW